MWKKTELVCHYLLQEVFESLPSHLWIRSKLVTVCWMKKHLSGIFQQFQENEQDPLLQTSDCPKSIWVRREAIRIKQPEEKVRNSKHTSQTIRRIVAQSQHRLDSMLHTSQRAKQDAYQLTILPPNLCPEWKWCSQDRNKTVPEATQDELGRNDEKKWWEEILTETCNQVDDTIEWIRVKVKDYIGQFWEHTRGRDVWKSIHSSWEGQDSEWGVRFFR